MDHKVHDPASIDPAQVLWRHLEKGYVVRQKMAGRGLNERKSARKRQADPSEYDQRPSVADERSKKTT
jgi:hypothetical protein